VVRPDDPSTTDLGRRGEDRALAYLEAHGLTLLERNYRCRAGEIDLILRDGTVLVLVEVRSRSRADFGSAAASIGRGKQRRFVTAAKHLLLTRPEFRRLRVRIDVVAIDPAPQPGGAPVVTWIRNAFAAS
jgi:putative endonuclease